MARNEGGLRKVLERIPELRQEFWADVRVTGTGEELNQQLEKAGRVADFLEFAELMALDALVREESCGAHFREEHQTANGEAERDDEQYSHVAAWEYGENIGPVLHKEALEFEYVHLAQRSYT
jgi:succinate dehydrogenase / fumarate reductase flavoprotein subunit